MRHRRITQYSAAGLFPLPPPITSEVHIALKYANSQVFGKVFCQKRSYSPVEKPLQTPVTPEPRFRETSTQVSVAYTEEKSVMTLPTRESFDLQEKSTDYDQPQPHTVLITETIDAASQVVEKIDISLQTIDGSMIKSPKKTENEENPTEITVKSPILTEIGVETTKNTKKSGKSAQTNAEFAEKQRKFESILAEREELERIEKEKQAKAEFEAQNLLLKQRKEKLIEKHSQYLEKKKLREKQRLEAEENFKKIRNAHPLHERLAHEFQVQATEADLNFRQELEKVRQRMRRIDAKEISAHEERYISVRESKIEEKSKVREGRMRQISAENVGKDYFQNHLLTVDMEERKAQAERRRMETAKAREILAKQRIYAEIAMELHRPKSFVTPHRPKTPQISQKPSFSVSPLTNNTKRRVRTVRQMVEKTQRSPSEASTVKDYNSERRLQLERSVFSSERMSPVFTYQSKELESPFGDVKQLREQAGRLSREAKRGETVIGRLHKDPELFVQACDNVSAMYLDSIKAKLRIVNSLFD